LGFGWLRETGRSSKLFHLELPILVHKFKHGEKLIAVDPTEVHNYLRLDEKAVTRLTKYFLYPKTPPANLKRIHIDRQALALQYKDMMDQGLFKNQSDLARHLGVSRVWICKIMNSLKQKQVTES
jgi:DNA-binding MarR family transcriptional regulator